MKIINFILLSLSHSEHVNYEGQQLVRFETNSPELNHAIEELNLDVWARTPDSVEVRATRNEIRKIKQKVGTTYKILSNNVQALIDNESQQINLYSANYFDSYHPYADILQWYQNLAQTYPDYVTYNSTIGRSVEGRNLAAVHITINNGKPKKHVWFQALIHAREWITGVSVQYLTQNFITKLLQKDLATNELFEQIELIIIPVVNPDGYVHTWTTDRLWRKNRAVINGYKYGVDLNRNWPFHWGEDGSSSTPNSETYKGPAPASEPEVKAIMAYYAQFRPSIVGAIDFHAYSQLILRPYGYTRKNAMDEARLLSLSREMNSAIGKVRGTKYQSIKSSELYPAAGITTDWFYQLGHPYAYTFELSPAGNRGANGFILPPSQIVPVGKEIVNAMNVFMDTVRKA